MQAHHAEFRMRSMARVLGVSRSGYYDWRDRPVSRRAEANRRLLAEIRRIHGQARGVYGARKTWRALTDAGIPCGRHRVARLRRLHGLEAKRRRRFKVTTHSRLGQWLAPNLVERHFTAAAPNRLWVGDVTFVATRQGWLYVAILLDVYARRIVGWAMGERINTALVLQALHMALQQRQPPVGLIHHTDRGAIYAADAYRTVLTQHGLHASMSRTGDCYDNAVAESFFSTLKNELTWGEDFHSRSEARTRVFEFIEVFYNRQRLHQSLGYRTPQAVEEQHVSLN